MYSPFLHALHPVETSVSAALGLIHTTPTNSGGLMKRLPSSGGGSLVTHGLSSMETMQKSVMNAFSLKYSQFVCVHSEWTL